jgi:hypothetical protein
VTVLKLISGKEGVGPFLRNCSQLS